MDLMNLFIKYGVLPQDEVLEYLSDKPSAFAEEILKNTKVLFLTMDDVHRYEETRAMEASNVDWKSRIEVLKDISGSSTTKGEIDDFVKYFNSRFRLLKKLLKKRSELIGESGIKGALSGNEKEVKVIGIVKSLKDTSSGGRRIEIEDENASMTVFCSDKKLASHVVLDSVIGVVAERPRKDFFYAKEILMPEVVIGRSVARSPERAKIAITSDVHIGSKTFMREKWDSFMEWLGTQDEIKYVLFCGDNVDGVGIYPGQEKDLEITNVYEQYELFAKELDSIPADKNVIVLPGNHDAVRPAEPQPSLSGEVKKLFSNNVMCVGSPCFMKVCDVPILAYHGRSMDDFIYANSDFTHSRPIDMMMEMLKLRHLAPIYGGKTPIAPESTDALVIEEVPDIFITGHVHSFGVGRYRNVTMVNGSTWQSQTAYQRMFGFQPNPGNVAIIELSTGGVETKSF